MMHSFGYSAMVVTSSHPGKMPLKMQLFCGKIAPSHNVKKNAARSSWAIPVPLLLKVGWFPVYQVLRKSVGSLTMKQASKAKNQ